MQTTQRPINRAWLPAVIWVVVIACESSAFGSSARTSRFLYPILLFFAPHLTAAQLQLAHGLARKVGHCFGYAVLSFVMLRAWWATLCAAANRLPPWRAVVTWWSGRAATLAFASAVMIASLDEWHQTFIPGRTGTIRDVALDAMAAVFVQLVVVAFSNVRATSAVGRSPLAIGHERQSPMANS